MGMLLRRYYETPTAVKTPEPVKETPKEEPKKKTAKKTAGKKEED